MIVSFASLSLATGKRLGQLVINPNYLSANWNLMLLKVILLISILLTLLFYGLFFAISKRFFHKATHPTLTAAATATATGDWRLPPPRPLDIGGEFWTFGALLRDDLPPDI